MQDVGRRSTAGNARLAARYITPSFRDAPTSKSTAHGNDAGTEMSNKREPSCHRPPLRLDAAVFGGLNK
jgi:hypothetical protein